MTRFEEIQALVEKNKNKKKGKPSADSTKAEGDLEVPGITESSKGGNPHMEFATHEQDMPLTEQLYRNPKHTPSRGEGVYWDQD